MRGQESAMTMALVRLENHGISAAQAHNGSGQRDRSVAHSRLSARRQGASEALFLEAICCVHEAQACIVSFGSLAFGARLGHIPYCDRVFTAEEVRGRIRRWLRQYNQRCCCLTALADDVALNARLLTRTESTELHEG